MLSADNSTQPPRKRESSWLDPLPCSYLPLDALLLIMLVNLSLQPLVDPDFGWHLRTGLDLIRTGWRLPETDPYSHTMSDWPWVEHAWLMDGLIGVTHDAFGAGGELAIILLFAVIITAAFLVGVAPAHAGWTMKLTAAVAAAWTALPFLGARMQMITLLGLGVILMIWRRYLHDGHVRLWAIPPLFLLWANLHGGFTAGLFLLGLIVTVSLTMRVIVAFRPTVAHRTDEPILSWAQIGHLTVMLSMAAVLTFVNPYGWHLHAEIYDSLTNQFMIDTLREWHPVSLESRAGLIYAAYLVILGLLIICFYRRIEPVRWTILIIFLALSLRHWRNVPFFLLVGLPLSAEMLAAFTAHAKDFLLAKRVHTKRLSFAVAMTLAIGMVLLGAGHLKQVVKSGLEPEEFFRESEYPIEAVQWVQAHHDQVGTRLYNDYGMGGFLLWRLPSERIFIDGRMPAWKLDNRWILYDYVALTTWDPPELRVLDKYGVDWAIVRRHSRLADVLGSIKEWKTVYADTKVRIYVRRRNR